MRAQLRAGHVFPSGPAFAAWPSTRPGTFYANFVAHRFLRRIGHRLCHLGHPLGDLPRCRQRAHAGDRSGRARGRAGLSQAPIQHHRSRRHRYLRDRWLFPGLAGCLWVRGRRHSVGRRGLHRHERLGARQCAHGAGGDQFACRRPGARVPRGRDHGHVGGRSRAPRRHALFRLSDRHAASGAEQS